MRPITQLLYSDKSNMTGQELSSVYNYIDAEARYNMDSYDFCCLLGWWVLGDGSIPLSPKEAGME